MKTETFNQNYQIDRTAKTPRGVERFGKPTPVYQDVLTGDGKPFDSSKTYFFFDGRAVQRSAGLRRVDAEHLGSLGYKVVPIADVFEDRDGALSFGQEQLRGEITALRQRIADLEVEKSTENKSLSVILDARNSERSEADFF